MADDIDDSIDDLRAKLEEERAARAAAEHRASTAETSARRASSVAGNEVQQSRMQILDSSMDQIKTQRDILKARYRSAQAEGDHDASAEIASEMGDVAARLLYLENGKAALQQQIDNPPQQQQPTGDQRPFNSLSSAEKVERIASTLSAPSSAWVRNHPEWAQSEAKVQALVGAHNAALARGKIADSDDYFEDIERMLEISGVSPRNGRDVDASATSAAAKAVRQREDVAPPAAPARSGSSSRTRTLTALERESARTSGLTDQEYAEQQDALLKEGRIVRH